MKNLRVLAHSYIELENIKNETLSLSKMSSDFNILCDLNPDTNEFYIWKDNYVHGIIDQDTIRSVCVEEESLKDSKLVGFEYCSITQQLYLANDCGELFSLSLDSKDSKPEFVARVDVGLKTMKLSPDHEIITLITLDEMVIVMTSNFHVIAEAQLNSADFGEKQFITVGWGKKETQFHGSEGKAAAKSEQVTPEISEADDGLPRISWRGDGSLFAVSFLSMETKIRQFKVFNREGLLQYTSELTIGLEENLAWKPSGNLIAVTQRLPNKHVVSFFEKNGLKHREFTLPFGAKEYRVKNLQWSNDSIILAIWCVNIKNGTTQIQLWIENNYHWYLKQTVQFSQLNPLLYCSWSSTPRSEKTLFILTKEMLLSYTFCWTINHSRGTNPDDKAIVGVIDGDKLLATGFRLAVIPPPMAHQIVQIGDLVNEVVFAPQVEDKDSWVNTNVLFTVLHNNRLAFYTQESKFVEYGPIKSYEIEWDIPISISEFIPYSMHHFLWYKSDLILSCAPLGTDSMLCIIRLDGINPKKEGRLIVQDTHMILGVIEHIISSPDPDVVYIVSNGAILTYSEDAGVNPTEIYLNESCHHIEVIKIENKHVIISLSYRNRLYIDGKEVANNITSFFVHTEFILLTTLQHSLVCVALDGNGFQKLLTQDLNVKPWEGAENEKFLSGLSIRRLERGSNLVMAVAKDTRTILQLPRGNLECIQPRALSLYIIGAHLNELNYYAAFDLIRKQRINLNIIHDHDAELFLANAEKFIEDVKEPSWLSLFLSELQEGDVTCTMYSSSYPQKNVGSLKANESSCTIQNKVEKVCEHLRKLMESRNDADRFLLPILTSLVKKLEIKDLEAALLKVKDIKLLESEKDTKLHSSSEEALKYLLYLVDVDVLFDIALGMYDFDLVMFIAEKSQKDPKEYIPFLNRLRQMDTDYMRFSIDVHLKRYISALNHISKCDDRFNECIHLIKTQKLYFRALKCFKVNTKEYKEIAKVYAKHLLSEQKYGEAAIMFTRSGNYTNALEAFKLAGDWQEAIIVAKQLNMSMIDLHNLYKDLLSQVKENKKYQEAAYILMHYLQESEDAIAVLCEGKLWLQALRIAYHVDRVDIVETHIKPGVQEHARHILSKITKDQEDFVKYKNRLRVVRAEKAFKDVPQMDIIGDYDVNNSRMDSDLYSDTSSIAGSVTSRGSQSSRSSGKSYRSSKNRRKQERKLYSLREGNMYEDLALINALHQIVTDAYASRGIPITLLSFLYSENEAGFNFKVLSVEVNSLERMLLRFYNDDQAEKLQNLFAEFLSLIEHNKLEIWPENLSTPTPDANSTYGPPELTPPDQSDATENLLKLHLRYPPIASSFIWQLDMLSPKEKKTAKT